jgi:hypothetical protein
MRGLKLYLLILSLIFNFLLVLPGISSANIRSSETLRGQKGLFRLLSADVNETGSYHFRTSVEFAQQDELLKDASNSTVQSKRATVAFGYAFLPELLISGHAGFNVGTRRPQPASGGSSSGSETIDLVKYGFAVTGTYDVGRYFHLPLNRFTTGLSLWTNFSKVTRFFKAVDIVPTLIATADFTDSKVVPFRGHFNVGFRPANGARYFNDDSAVRDFDRYVTETINSYAITSAIGAEFPMFTINPSLEAHIEKVADASFSRAPKWITAGLKGKPFPQKNVELFAAVDVGLSSFKATPSNPPKPEVGPVPLWNIMIGFGIAQFGKKSNEIAVDQIEYERTKNALENRERTLAAVQHDLEYNTVQGTVVDAANKQALAGVSISFPDNADLKSSKTDNEGKFVRYFKNMSGARMLFSKEGYESSSKFLALKPGERVNVDIELKKSTGEALADFVGTITNEAGKGITATVTLTDLKTNESTVATADANGQVQIKVKEGSYRIEIKAPGLKSTTDQIQFLRGKTVLRFYSLAP